VRYLRRKNKMTVEELAASCNTTVSAIRSYEDGRAMPRMDKIPEMCEALKYYDVIAMIKVDLMKHDVNFGVMGYEKMIASFRQIQSIIAGAIPIG